MSSHVFYVFVVTCEMHLYIFFIDSPFEIDCIYVYIYILSSPVRVLVISWVMGLLQTGCLFHCVFIHSVVIHTLYTQRVSKDE